MYKYVYFYHVMYFGYLFIIIIFILSNTCYEFSLLNKTFSMLFCEKTNYFFYSFVTIIPFCFMIIIVILCREIWL